LAGVSWQRCGSYRLRDKDGLSVVQKTVEQGGGHGSITGEDTGPVLEGDVGSDDSGAMLVAFWR